MSDYVPNEVIVEIFARLPPKSLIRFQSLSKSWSSYIVSSDFIRKHDLLSPEKVFIRHRDYLGIISIKDFEISNSEDRLPFYRTLRYWNKMPEKFRGHSSDLIGSCNGVLCFSWGSTIILWNPSIRRVLTLPNNSVWGDMYKRQVFGFGYDPFTDDYKVVMVLYSIRTTKVAESSLIYSIKAGAWRPIAAPSTLIFYVISLGGFFLNGVLHWIVREDLDHHYIMTFDLSSEVFGMITLPGQSSQSKKLTTINGSIAVISDGDDDQYSLIWMRKEYNNVLSWSKVFKFKGLIYGILQLANGNFLVKSSHDRFIVWNPVTRVQSRLIKSEDCCLIEMLTHVETFGLMDKGAPCNGYQPFPSSLSRLQFG